MNIKIFNEITEVKSIHAWKKNHDSNPFEYNIPSHDLFSTEWDEIVPFGDKCASALALVFNNYRTQSYPFDWVVIFPKQILEILKNNFEDFYSKDADSYANKYGIFFGHFENNSHFVNYDNFQRRAQRMIDLLNSKKKVLFLYTTESHALDKNCRDNQDETYDNLKCVAGYLHDKYPLLDFKILACNLNNDRQNTEDIVNINIRCDKKLLSDNGEDNTPEIYMPYRVTISDIVSNLKLASNNSLQNKPENNSSPRVTIGLVLYKGEQYLKYSLPSLVDQDYPNIEYLFRDQSPNGEAYEYIIRELPDVAKKVKLEKGENLMHSGGHNALIRKMTGDYYISASYDMLHEPDFVSKMVNEMEKPKYKEFGSGTCKILKWDFNKAKKGNIEGSKTTKIDSVGIAIGKSHGFWDMKQGKDINELPNLSQKNIDVFGATAALAIYRKSALDDIAYIKDNGEKEYFDELMHQYNDVDLAYRLQWAGYSCLYMPVTTVFHDRQAAFDKLDESERSKWIRNNSLFGHMLLLKKNYTKDYSLNIRIKTLQADLKRFFDFGISDDDLFEQYKKIRNLKVEINKKRDNIIRRKTAKDIEKYIKW